MSDRIETAAAAKLLHLSPSEVRRKARSVPGFPQPEVVSPRVYLWDPAEILAWRASRRGKFPVKSAKRGRRGRRA